MKLLYITIDAPFGQSEPFITEEILVLKQKEIKIFIVPRTPAKKVFEKKAECLINDSLWLPLINLKIIIYFFNTSLFFTRRNFWKYVVDIFKYSRNLSIFIKNFAVLPKAVYIAGIVKRNNIHHIHAHWGSTTSTMAWLVSKLTNIPWSFTLHRWDIKEDNMLKEKVRSAKFTRCISEHGKNELLQIVGKEYKGKIKVIYMGVKIPKEVKNRVRIKKILIATPANLIEVKGHKYLIEACSILVKKEIRNFQCIFYGNGPLRKELSRQIKKNNLAEYIKLSGFIAHDKLIERFKNLEIDIVVLPSILTNTNEHEGVPIALIEAMAYSIPVISTNTGGIPELLSEIPLIMVEDKNSKELAMVMEKLIKNAKLRKNLGIQGYKKVYKNFNIEKNIQELIKNF